MPLPPTQIKAKEITHRGDRFRVQAKRAEAERSLARRKGVEPLGTVFVDTLEIVSPADTNRFIRGWQLAANDAGLPPRAVLPVKDSARRDEFIEALESQVAYWVGEAEDAQERIDSYDAIDAQRPLKKDGTPRKSKRSSPAYARAVRRRNTAIREITKAEEILGEAVGAEGFLLFDKGGFAAGRRGGYGKRKRFRSTIRTRVYGGRGSIEDAGGVAIVSLHNLEPHATIVARSARHGRPVNYAYQAVRLLGGAGVSKGYIDAIGRVTGWTENRRGLAQGGSRFTKSA